MAKTDFDPIDIGLLVVGLISSFIMVGIATFDLFGVDFGATVTTLAGFDISTAYVLSAASVAGVVITNDNTSFGELRDDVEQLDQYYMASVAGTFAFLGLWLIFPEFAEFVQSEDLWGLGYTMIVTTGTLVMGWIL